MALYVEKARPILPVLAEPHQAVVLVRLLADEGVIGAWRRRGGRRHGLLLWDLGFGIWDVAVGAVGGGL